MKTLLLFLVSVSLMFGQAALVQQANALDNAAVGFVTVTLGVNHTGNLLVAQVSLQQSGGDTITTITGGGTTWYQAAQFGTSLGQDTEIWYGVNSTGSAGTITITSLTNSYFNLVAVVSEWSGFGPSPQILSGVYTNTGTTTGSTTGTIITPGGYDLVMGTITSVRTINSGPTNSFTALTSPLVNVADVYQIETSSGSFSTGWGQASAGRWTDAIVSFSPSPRIAVTPNTAQNNSTSNIKLTLTGTGTAWTGGTVFTISGPAGVSKVSQTVATGTSGTLTISTSGSAPGVATVSDGSLTGTVNIGSSEPYLESFFYAPAQAFRISSSGDGLHWNNYSNVPAITGVRDPSIVQLDNGTWLMAYNDNTTGNISTVTLYSGKSLSTLAFLAYVNVVAGQRAWAPTFFIDPPTRQLYMTVSIPTAGYGMYLLSANQSSPSVWSAPTQIMVFNTLAGYDGSLWLSGGTYYMFYALASTGSLYYATSSTINGTYTGQNLVLTGSTTLPYETPILTYSAISGYRLYLTQAGGDNGGFYAPLNNSFVATGGPYRMFVDAVNQPQHGTILNNPPPSSWMTQ